MSLIDKVTSIKERRVKQNSQKWFDGENADEIKNRDKLFKKFKKSKLHIDKDIHDAASYRVKKAVFNIKRVLFEKKVKEKTQFLFLCNPQKSLVNFCLMKIIKKHCHKKVITCFL